MHTQLQQEPLRRVVIIESFGQSRGPEVEHLGSCAAGHDDSHHSWEESPVGSTNVLGGLLLDARDMVLLQPKRCSRLSNYLVETCASLALATKELAAAYRCAHTWG